MQWDVLIIGSGISSLTCAALLAKKGKKVAVFEQYRKPGGYLHTFSRFGCHYDTGSHYVGGIAEGQPFRTLLEYLDAFDPDLFVPLDPDGFDVFKFPTWEIALPVGHAAAVERIAEYFPKEKDAIIRYFDLVAKVALSFPTYQYDERVNANAMIETLSTPLSRVVESLTDDLQLRNLFYCYCSLHCVAPQHTPFGFHAVMTDSLLRGAYGFKFGGDGLAKKLIKSLENAGGKIFLRNGVTDMVVEDDHVKEIVTKSGEHHTAEWVISGAHPKATFALVGEENLRPAFKKRLRGIDETVALFGIYAACKQEPPLRTDRNYYAFSSENTEDFMELYNPARTPEDIPKGVYLSRNNRSHKPGSEGFYPLTIHAPGPMHWFDQWRGSRFADRPGAYYDRKEAVAQTLLKFCEQAFPGVEASIDSYETSSSLSNLFYNGSIDGSAYGIYHSIQNTGVRGLGPRTHIRNLLITGQSTLFPGLLASSIAGMRTAGHIIGVKPVLQELRLHREQQGG